MSAFTLSTIPALETAATDSRLTPHEKAVVLWCYHTPLLNVVEFLPLKLATVQLETGIRERTAVYAVHHLANLGYLQCAFGNPAAPAELRRATRPRWYRLAFRVDTARAA